MVPGFGPGTMAHTNTFGRNGQGGPLRGLRPDLYAESSDADTVMGYIAAHA